VKELYGVDMPVTVRSNGVLYPMALRVPGWINFGILKARAVPIVKQKRRAKR
jgi:hypothetical protein